ncbi:hypothetical protein APHAL10511_000503 [Amanita phalloides]|nr:hypothetical protein APHAL10511_000503 [Amanita phalloides]
MAESTGSSDTTDPERELEGGYLYAVLTYNGELALWNWAFFIPDPSKSPIGSSGVLFRIVPEAEDRRAWKYMTEKHDVLSWPLVVAIVQLGDISSLGEYDNLIAKDGLIPIFEQVRYVDMRSLRWIGICNMRVGRHLRQRTAASGRGTIYLWINRYTTVFTLLSISVAYRR